MLRVICNMARRDVTVAGVSPIRSPTRKVLGLRSKWPPLAALAVVLLFGTAFVAWRMIHRSSVPIVAVMPADGSAGAATIARDLVVKLGSLRAARLDTVKLIGPENGGARSADFIFEVARSRTVNLMLLAGRDHALLWSKDFDLDAGGEAALEQRVAYTAAQVLGCSLEALGVRGVKLDEQTVKLYLNGCALLDETYRADPRPVVPIFSQVVARAPSFKPAWAKLLLAEGQIARGEMLFNNRPAPGDLPQHIRTAERLDPRLPELYIAKTALLPIAAFLQRQQLINEAFRTGPDNPHLLVVRSELYEFVGRTDEAVQDAARAAELDPLSPGLRSNHIQTLAYAGRIPAARQELARAEQLWPGTAAIEDSRFRLNSRYGDAREALRMARSKGVYHLAMTPNMEAFLVARIEPTVANVEKAITATRSAELTETRRMVELAQVLGEFGREEELYSELFRWPILDRAGIISSVLFRPALRKFRQDPRFMLVAKRLGLIDYWRATGKWPDFCFEPDLPYGCKAEAAKLAA